MDKNVCLLYIFFGSTFLHRIWAHNPWCAMLVPPLSLPFPSLLPGGGAALLRWSHGAIAAAHPTNQLESTQMIRSVQGLFASASMQMHNVVFHAGARLHTLFAYRGWTFRIPI